jgi:hypothetical protein
MPVSQFQPHLARMRKLLQPEIEVLTLESPLGLSSFRFIVDPPLSSLLQTIHLKLSYHLAMRGAGVCFYRC